ncbi:MAG: bifunctional diaminohydroxyphosphoribosylaminopyrimidine deaminase/5-amino-6-(5-phosphoribosylamino)uracil reductase RibD [Candidatus Acidiferrales bacterium]
MSRALRLAQRSTALAHPNPLVGAVLVKNDRVVGEGFHTYDGRRHAEIIALENAGQKARGATLYVNLEPCCHTGRTGPCTDSIIAAGVKRVVAAMDDPNPAVAGRGLRQLRRAGVKVEVGLRRRDARYLNEAFACWIRTGKPLVTLKSALTLDGQIASPHGTARWITSPASREEVQRLRHASDAILTGIGTVLADDPRLTDRTGLPRRRRLLRVVLDSRLRLPLRSTLVKSAENDVLVFTIQAEDSHKGRKLRRAGIEVARVHARRGHVNLDEVIHELGRRQILSVLLEAGSKLNGGALEAGIVDKIILFYAPKILGSVSVPLASLRAQSLEAAPLLRNQRLLRIGPDFAVEGYLRDVYGDRRIRRKN